MALKGWIITEGIVSMQNQCLGLAEALGVSCDIKHVLRPSAPWRYLPTSWWPNPLESAEGIRLMPPWPDVLFSSGRGSVAAALAIKRASGGKTLAVHIQHPFTNPKHFDIVVVPEHDSLRGHNVLVSRRALHCVTRRRLDEAAKYFSPLFSQLPRPLFAVLVGGSNKRMTVSPGMMAHFAERLAELALATGAGLAVTTSRRTGAENETILRERLKNLPMHMHDGIGENPYLGMLALADAIIVTGDSISMISEASATGKPVYVYHFGGDNRRQNRFHAAMTDDGVTRPFDGIVENWSYQIDNDAENIAKLIRERFPELFS